MGLAGPVHDDRQLDLRPRRGRRDPVLGIDFLREAYERRFPEYDKGITVPAIVDVPTGLVVTNDFPMDHPRPLLRVVRAPPPRRARTSGPTAVRDEMDEVMERIYTEVNNGVYRCGFAGTQERVRRGVRPPLRRPWTGSRSASPSAAT